eukprot:138375-Prorocentrum_minimum.AAC.4
MAFPCWAARDSCCTLDVFDTIRDGSRTYGDRTDNAGVRCEGIHCNGSVTAQLCTVSVQEATGSLDKLSETTRIVPSHR